MLRSRKQPAQNSEFRENCTYKIVITKIYFNIRFFYDGNLPSASSCFVCEQMTEEELTD